MHESRDRGGRDVPPRPGCIFMPIRARSSPDETGKIVARGARNGSHSILQMGGPRREETSLATRRDGTRAGGVPGRATPSPPRGMIARNAHGVREHGTVRWFAVWVRCILVRACRGSHTGCSLPAARGESIGPLVDVDIDIRDLYGSYARAGSQG